MKRLMFACCLLLAWSAAADPAAFKGRWEGTLARESHTNAYTLEIDEALHGRLLQDGEEFGPISDAKVDGNVLTFRVDTIAFKGLLDGDRLALTIAVSHGKTFEMTMTRKVAPPAHAGGALILAGGGANAPEIVQRFIELAGGPNAPIVVIPTAADTGRLRVTPERSAQLRARHAEIFRTNDVTVLHTRDRNVADSDEFVKPLRRARGVWILGGETSWLLDAYRGTRTEREIKAVVARGGVVGGTSAGAIVQTSTLLSEDGKRRIDGFGLLSGVFVWPHWSERHAEDALVKATARLGDVVGIGIDEATAIVVQGSAFDVVGLGNVGISDGKGYYLLHAGDRFDLATKTPRTFRGVMSSYEGRFRGSVLVARGDDVVFRWANTPATSFRIGSLTKQFTAAAILLLEERGKLRTGDRLRAILPEVPAAWDGVTLYHLLTHTSGIPSDLSPRLNAQPGTEFMYSNEGYVLLGNVIERVTGATYGGFIAANIFTPLGMRDSSADPELAALGGAGALRSTAGDLLAWQRALFGGTLLSRASLAKMTTPFRNGYGCALHEVVSAGGHRVFANDGRVPGSGNASFRYYVDEKLVVIVLSDLDTQVDNAVARDLALSRP